MPFTAPMKKIAVGGIIVAIAIAAIGLFAFAKGGERKIQFLEKGAAVAAADVSILERNFTETRLTTAADGSLCLPAGYKGGLICLKVTKQGNVIFEKLMGDVPPGVTIIDLVSNNRVRFTEKMVLMGMVVHTETRDEIEVAHGVNTQAVEAASPYAGEWQGHSESSPTLKDYDWRFQLARNGRFQITMSREESGFSESISGTWKSGTDGVTLFPDQPGKVFFPVADKALEKEGVGYAVFIKQEGDAFEFTFGCCDERGSDYRVKATRSDQ